jgi:hypothetical protein
MPTLQIEHEVPSYEGWKQAFDSDPINRKQSGVKKYRIYKNLDEEKVIIVELDFDNIEDLNATHRALQNLWNRVQGTVMANPRSRIIELLEANDI